MNLCNKVNREFHSTLISNDKLDFKSNFKLVIKIFKKFGLPFFCFGINGKLNF